MTDDTAGGAESDGDPDDAAEPPAEYVELATFDLAGEVFAIEVGHVDQLLDAPETDRLPRTGPAVDGVAYAGGEVTVVIDVAALFGLESAGPVDPSDPPQLVTVDRGSDRQAIGLRIPTRTEIVTVPSAAVEPPDAAGVPVPEPFVLALAEPEDAPGVVYVLDVAGLIEGALDDYRSNPDGAG